MYRLFALVNLIFALGLGISYLCPFFDPSLVKVISIFGLLHPFLLLLNVAFVVYWLFSNHKGIAFISIIALLLGYNSITRLFQFNAGEEIAANSFKILSYNIRGSHLSKHQTAEFEEINNYFNKKKDVDIFCFQEKRKDDKSVINSILSGFNKTEGTFGSGIYTKLPIVDKGIVQVGGNTKDAIWADIKLSNSETIRVYNFHLSSNLITKAKDEIIKDANIADKKTWNTIEGMFKNYARYAIMRKQQIDILLEHVERSPHPVILVGDLNDVPQSNAYRRISKNRSDSFLQRGTGFGTSYRGRIPLLRIDYVFAEESMNILEHSIGNVSFSDHYPLEVEIELNAP